MADTETSPAWEPMETRTQFTQDVISHWGFLSEEEWARRTGREVRPCRTECDYGACTGWMQASVRSETVMYLVFNAERLLSGENYRSPYLWSRNR